MKTLRILLYFALAALSFAGVSKADSSGFVSKDNPKYSEEIFAESANCKYGDCTHTHEPGCAVRQAVEEHRISESRYASYLNMLEDSGEAKYRQAY